MTSRIIAKVRYEALPASAVRDSRKRDSAHQTIFAEDFREYQYRDADWILMPVQRNGRPFHRGWPTYQFGQRSIVAKAERLNSNLAVRLNERQLVINVPAAQLDNFNSFTRPHSQCVFPEDYPAVVVPSKTQGGQHSIDFYCRFSGEIKELWYLKQRFPAFRFFSKGKFVIAAGSVSPFGEPYSWVDWPDNVPLWKAPEICA